MRANGEVPAPQGRVAMSFSVQGRRSRANLVATEPRRGPKLRYNVGNPGNVGYETLPPRWGNGGVGWIVLKN